MSATPRFSVILPTYRRAHLLGRALVSLWAQTRTDFEVILVDSSPADERAAQSPELQPLLADPRLRLIELPQRASAAQARNAALEVARGEWVVYQDDDDTSAPHRLSALDARIRHEPGTSTVLSGLRYHLHGRQRLVQCSANCLGGDARWTAAFPAMLAICHRRENAPRFREDLGAGEDNAFYFALLSRFRPAHIPVVAAPLVDVYPQPGSQSVEKSRRLVRTWLRILREFRAELPPAVRRHYVLHTAVSRYKYHRLDRGFFRYASGYLGSTEGRGWRFVLNVLLARTSWGRRRVVS